MAGYWYFVATLPNLSLGQAAPLGSEAFLERAKAQLKPEDYAALSAASLNSPPDGPVGPVGGSAVLADYRYWERCLRNELARARARRLGRPTEAWVRPLSERHGPAAGPASSASLAASAATVATAAASAEDPLKGELLLERERWTLLENLKAFHYFDLEVLAAYRLQLQILERIALLRPETGEEGYRATYADMLEPARSTDKTGVPR